MLHLNENAVKNFFQRRVVAVAGLAQMAGGGLMSPTVGGTESSELTNPTYNELIQKAMFFKNTNLEHH